MVVGNTLEDRAEDVVEVAPSAAAPDAGAAIAVQQDSAPADVEQEAARPQETKVDIEHQPVQDDPRLWSPGFKWALVAMLSAGALIPTMAANIFFPAIEDLKRDLHGTDSLVALSVSLYILAQGTVPLLWSPISEIVGRKPCFLVAMFLFTVSMAIIAAATENMATLIVFRVIGAMGSSATLSIAAGALADLYEPSERGVKVGVYYCAPLIGPALAPIFGGALTEAGSWRLTFYFMTALGGASFLTYLFFRETFRVERSLAWQKARKTALERAAAEEKAGIGKETRGEESRERIKDARWKRWKESRFAKVLKKGVRLVWLVCMPFEAVLAWCEGVTARFAGVNEQEQEQEGGSLEREQTTSSNAQTFIAGREQTPYIAPSYHGPALEALHTYTPGEEKSETVASRATRGEGAAPVNKTKSAPVHSQRRPAPGVLTRKTTGRSVTGPRGEEIKFKPTLADVSPLGSAGAVLKQPHNVVALFYSALGFASQYSLSYTASRTFSAAPYNFSPILVGLVLLALGVGGVLGSILGGRLSDLSLARESARLGGRRAAPEHRILSVRWPMLLCPPAFVGYAWSAEYKAHVAAPVVCLVVLGFSFFWIYSATLSYIVDSNTGRSSGAVACNSASRGFLAFIASEVAGPIQDAVGDGALYTGWAVLLTFGQLGLLVVGYRGMDWRDEDWRWPKPRDICMWIATCCHREKGQTRPNGVGEIRQKRKAREEQQQQQSTHT